MIALETLQIERLHPLLVHLPIGIFFMALAMEVTQKVRPGAAFQLPVRFALALTGITALLSLGTGWLLGNEGGFNEDILFFHRWLAVAFTGVVLGLYFLKRTEVRWARGLYFPVFFTASVLLVLTGHYGGNLTHGTDYLFSPPKERTVTITDVAEAQVYADIVQPILDNKCVGCHNATKNNGGLLATGFEALKQGGDSGSVFDSVNGEALLMHRIRLPLDEEEHMPPKGKAQLTPEEMALLQWWVANNHCKDCKTKELDTPENMEPILAGLEEDSSPHALMAKKVDKVPDTWLAELRAEGIVIYPLAEGNPLLMASLYGKKEGLKQKLGKLDAYADNIVELNLGDTGFTDALAPSLSKFKNLTKLQLQNNPLTASSLDVLSHLEHLESLNLYGTQVNDAVLETVKKLPSLKSLYLFGTEATTAAMTQFQKDFPWINMERVEGDIFPMVQLSAPTILAETAFFKDTMTVALGNTFEDARLYYTLDGTDPDSTSLRYKTPFTLDRSATVRAMVMKEGWKPSPISSQSFRMAHIACLDATLSKPPSEKYKGQLGKTLIDLKRGTTSFIDGNWLGYEGSHFSATIALKEVDTVRSVSVGALTAQGSWIFYPVGFTVATYIDGKGFVEIKRMSLPKTEPISEVDRAIFEVEISPTPAKFVRVEVRSQLSNPSWHPNPGGKSWVFIDEIVLN